jgi:hypothetical protein
VSARNAEATGGCQCGAVRYALYVAPQGAHACHCRMCQRAVGGAFALLAGAPKPDFAWTKGAPKFFASSNLAQRGFCGDCGTPLSFAYNRPENRIYVTMGSLDEPAAAPIESQVGVESKWAWVSFCVEVPQESTGASAPEEYLTFIRSMVKNQS